MRLKASQAENLKEARNTLTQRVQGPSSEGTVEMELTGLKDGNVAGFGIFEFPYAYVAIEQENGKRRLVMCNDGENIETIPDFQGEKLWIRARVMDRDFRALFYYSTDGINYKRIGNTLKWVSAFPGQPTDTPCSTSAAPRKVSAAMLISTGSGSPANKRNHNIP